MDCGSDHGIKKKITVTKRAFADKKNKAADEQEPVIQRREEIHSVLCMANLTVRMRVVDTE